MRKSILVMLCALLLAAGAAEGSGPKAGDLHGDDVIATAADGTVFTAAMIDSMLATSPQSVRNAFKKIGLVWHGDRRYLSFAELAAYCAPVLWFSPDEPLLDRAAGLEIRMPTFFPFEAGVDSPVVYYRVREIQEARDNSEPSPVLADVDSLRNDTTIDLKQVGGIDLDFFFFYPSEEGLGAHKYDVESVQMKLVVVHPPKYPELGYWLTVQKITAKAHGVLWYDNNLVVDRHTHFPVHLLVEEGKHATCTDKNGDGHYTPAYDVNMRVNDAWGVRDVMSSGSLYTGGYQGWMTKPRHAKHRVLPPLPEDSPHRAEYEVDGVYAPDNAVYQLRPFPRLAPALAYDPALKRFVDKGDQNWPQVETYSGLKQFAQWSDSESFVKSISASYRYDGQSGMSVVFPLLVVKNVSDPIAGGWLVNRVYFKDRGLRDASWNLLYTSSASRWLDGYFTFGWEWDDNGTSTTTYTMSEVGVKLRFNLGASPLKFLGKLTDFWGVRVGLKYLGLWDVKHLGYAMEIGAGSF